MKEKLKITITDLSIDSNTGKQYKNNRIQGFLGTLYRQDGTTIVRECVEITKQRVIQKLGTHAKWFNENILGKEDESEDTKPRDEPSEEDSQKED